MWPFSHNEKPSAVPAIRCGDIDVTWSHDFQWWEFSDGDFDYSLCENPIFDLALLSQLPKVAQWIESLESEIDRSIKDRLAGYCDWDGKKNLVGIDVSWLATKREIDVAYAHENWSDLGVHVVITDGKVTNSYAGD